MLECLNILSKLHFTNLSLLKVSVTSDGHHLPDHDGHDEGGEYPPLHVTLVPHTSLHYSTLSSHSSLSAHITATLPPMPATERLRGWTDRTVGRLGWAGLELWAGLDTNWLRNIAVRICRDVGWVKISMFFKILN